MILFLYITIICFLPILDPYIPTTNFGAGFPDIGAVRIGSYLLFLVFILHCSLTKRLKIINNWIGIVAYFYVFVFASISWSNYSFGTSTLQELFNSAFIPLFFAIVALNIFEKKESVEKYFISVTIAASILSIISIVQLVLGSSIIFGEARSTATFGNPNGLAIFLVLTIPCILYAIKNRLILGRFSWIFAALVIGGILFTVSKKGIITMVCCFFLYYLLKKNYRNVFLSISLFSLLAIAFSGYSMFSKRFDTLEIKTSIENKWDMTVAGWEMFKTSPLIGLGYKGYYDNYGNYFPLAKKRQYDAHNIFITALANYGILGFGLFISIFLYPLLTSSRILINKNSNKFIKDMAIVCISSIIPFMISGWFAGGLFYAAVFISLLFTNIVLVFSQVSKKESNI